MSERTAQKSVEVFISKTAKSTEKIGERLSREIAGGDVILLDGELGAGKTVFCKGLAKGFGVTGDVVSPTFTLLNEYVGGRIKLCHIDAYRLSDSEEAIAAGLAEVIGAPDCVCAVEWWSNIPELFDGCRTIKVDIQKTPGAREVTVTR